MSFRADHPYAFRALKYSGYAAGFAVIASTGLYASWENLPYLSTTPRSFCQSSRFTAGVVFTGTDQRIERAKQELGKKYNYLLISGTSASSALVTNEPDFLRKSGTGPTLIYIDRSASNTKQNAENTIKWLDTLPLDICRLDVITSEMHGPRTAFWINQALGKRRPPIAISFDLVNDHTSTRLGKIREMFKTAAAVLGVYERGPVINRTEEILNEMLGFRKHSQIDLTNKVHSEPRL